MPELALGTAQFGMDYGINNDRGKIPQTEVCKILKFAKENYISLLDTAYLYGESERVIGDCLKQLKLNFKIVTKIPYVENLESAKEVIKTSLKRLGKEKIYGCLIHNFHNYLKHPKIWNYLLEIKNQGLIEKIGFSLYHPSEIEFLLKEKVRPQILQIPLSIFDQRFLPLLPHLKKLNVEIHVRSIFLQGLVFKKPEDLPLYFKPIIKNLAEINRLSEQEEIPLHALFLNFVFSIKEVDYIVIGVDGISHLSQQIEALSLLPKVLHLKAQLQALAIKEERILLPYLWPKES